MTMALTKCKYCDHGNPPDSKYCNSCGATLTLAPCPHCGAVNDVAAATCYQCRGNLLAVNEDAFVTALPATVSTAPATRRPSRTVVGSVVLAIIAFTVYYAYRQSAPVMPLPSAATGTDAKGRADSSPPVPKVPVTGTAAFTAALPSGAASATPAPSPPPQVILRRTDTEPAVRPEAAAATAVVARPRAPEAARAGELQPPRIGPCTERVAALGLCSPTLISNKEAEAAMDAVPAAAARPQANTDGKPCTEAAAALGLCTR
jgi:hypothetical protein